MQFSLLYYKAGTVMSSDTELKLWNSRKRWLLLLFGGLIRRFFSHSVFSVSYQKFVAFLMKLLLTNGFKRRILISLTFEEGTNVLFLKYCAILLLGQDIIVAKQRKRKEMGVHTFYGLHCDLCSLQNPAAQISLFFAEKIHCCNFFNNTNKRNGRKRILQLTF